jgi:hypothetical protein
MRDFTIQAGQELSMANSILPFITGFMGVLLILSMAALLWMYKKRPNSRKRWKMKELGTGRESIGWNPYLMR